MLGIRVPDNNLERITYNGVIDTAKKIYKYEGISAFYKGLTPNMIKIFPSSGIFFLTYEATLKFLKPNRHDEV